MALGQEKCQRIKRLMNAQATPSLPDFLKWDGGRRIFRYLSLFKCELGAQNPFSNQFETCLREFI